MLAIEGFGNRFRDAASLEIVREHRGPGDRLEEGPMAADCREERDNYDKAAKTT